MITPLILTEHESLVLVTYSNHDYRVEFAVGSAGVVLHRTPGNEWAYDAVAAYRSRLLLERGE